MGQRIVQNHPTLSFKVTYNLKSTWNSEDKLFFVFCVFFGVPMWEKTGCVFLCVLFLLKLSKHTKLLVLLHENHLLFTNPFFSWIIRSLLSQGYRKPSLAPKRYFKEMPNAELILIMAIFGNIPCIFPIQKRRLLQLIHWAYHLWAPRGYFLKKLGAGSKEMDKAEILPSENS